MKFINNTATLESHVDEYIEYLIPKDAEYNFVGEEDEGELDKETLEKLNTAKVKPIQLEFNDNFKLIMINNTFFGDLDSILKNNIPVFYKIRTIDNGKNNIKHITFIHDVPNKIADLQVTQDIVAYAYTN